MKKALSAIAFVAALFSPFAALAQVNEATNEATTAAAGAVAGVAVGGMMVFFGAMILVGLAFLIFWVLMLIDCAKREFPDKNTWLIVLIVSFFVGMQWLAALLYYFMVKNKNLGPISAPMVPPALPTPPAPPAA